jgi:alpha/beta superfamily hydrolase
MAVDIDLLERHRRHEDESAGISEEFLRPRIGGRGTVAVLSRPLGRSLPVGWVVCHSLGMEQIHLGRLDVTVARGLSAAGFPVLRFHGQGYGDSEGTAEGIGLASHLAEATDAVGLMARQEGVEQVGVMGGRFGGTVAALVAERLDLPFMALWEPSVRGSVYMRDLLRSRVFAQLVSHEGAGGAGEMDRLKEELSVQGWSDIKGFRLSGEAHDEIAAIDLLRDVKSFSGTSLMVGVSRSPKMSSSVAKFAEHLTALGGECSSDVVQDPFAPQFGQFRFQTVDGGRGKRDVQLEMTERIAEVTVAWSVSQVAERAARMDVLP